MFRPFTQSFTRAVARRPALLLAATTLLWGSTFIVTKDVVRTVAPLLYVTLRFGIAALALLAFFPRSWRPSRRVLRDGLVLGIGQASGLLLQVLAQVYTTASKASFITALSTVLTPLLALWLYRVLPRRQQVAGVALATIGLALLTWPGASVGWNRGDLLSLGCAVLYAVVIVETARRAKGADAAVLTTWQTVFGALFFVVLLVGAHGLLAVLPDARLPEILRLEARPFPVTAAAWAQILYMALVCTVLTFLAQTFAMARMSAARAAVVFSLEPVFATALAVVVDGAAEWPGGRGVLGGALILVGVLCSELRRAQRAPAPMLAEADTPRC